MENEIQQEEYGILYIVATPIGNLEDITLRAIRILSEVAVVFCEDTRVTRRLFERHGITTHLKSLNARTESTKSNLVVGLLSEGKDVAYVSDAGTPAISDPGLRLGIRAREASIRVETIPGPSAVTAALSISSLDTSSFTFLGFLPHKKGRQTLLKEIQSMHRTVVLYESTHRILKLLVELQIMDSSRKICIARELTKVHEEVLCGTALELHTLLSNDPQKQKGEFVVMVTGA